MAAARQTRRRPAEVRALLLDAAATEFAANGLHGATTTDIAKRAGVSMSAMYRHFDDKSALFREAMLAPLVGFLDDFAITWQSQRDEPWDDFRLMRAFVESLYTELAAHRSSLVALISAAEHLDWDVVQEVRSSVALVFDDIFAIGAEESARRGWYSSEGLDVALRLIVSMVFGVVAFEQIIMPGGQTDGGRDEMFDQSAALVIWGLRRAPSP